MRMSYRRAWLLLEDLNTSFEQPVAHASVGGRGGGGVVLTAFGVEPGGGLSPAGISLAAPRRRSCLQDIAAHIKASSVQAAASSPRPSNGKLKRGRMSARALRRRDAILDERRLLGADQSLGFRVFEAGGALGMFCGRVPGTAVGGGCRGACRRRGRRSRHGGGVRSNTADQPRHIALRHMRMPGLKIGYAHGG